MNESREPLEPEPHDETRLYSVVEICRVCALPRERLVEYVAHGVVVGVGRSADPADERFSDAELRRLIRAVKIRRELEVELPNLALVVDLMETLERQRRELEQLRRALGSRREG